MSRFVVNLAGPEKQNAASTSGGDGTSFLPSPVQNEKPKKRGGCLKILGVLGGLLALLLLGAAIGGYFYWQSVKRTPEYSLALLVDAARRDDKAQMELLVDTQAVVENFMPQVTYKALELYGRGLPPQTIAKIEQAAMPVLPIIKERAQVELPRLIREKSAAVEKVPYWMIALFAGRAVEIRTEGDTAFVKSKIAERPLEITMQSNISGGDNQWKVVAIKDDVLARKIAEKIGQDIIAVAAKSGLKKAVEQLGVKNSDWLKKAEDIFK